MVLGGNAEELQYAVPIAVSVFLGILLLKYVLEIRRNSKLPNKVIHPPHLRSYIPYIGSAMRMVSGNTKDFISETAKSLNTSVFTATIVGTKCVFIADPDLVFVVFKESIKEIDSLSLQKKAMISLSGIDKANVDEIFQDAELGKKAMGQIHKYLIHTEHLTKSIEQVQRVIDHTANRFIESSKKSDANENSEWASHSMFEFIQKMVFCASIGPLISMELNDDSVVKDFVTFDSGLAYLFMDTPSFLIKDVVAARERLIKKLMEKKVHDGFTEFFRARKEMLGNKPELFARANLMMFIATVSNSIPAVFWVLFHILTDVSAFEACVENVQKVARERKGEYFTLEELDRMTVLQSCFSESLRIYQTFFVTRDVNKDFILNPKGNPKFLVEKGSRIMAYPNTVHMDPEIFEDPEVFKFDRFLDLNKKRKNGKLLINQLRPFGGGAHLCPGRKFIGYETQAFLAMMLLRLDMKIKDPNNKPGIKSQRQGAGVAHPDFDPIFLVRAKNETN